MILEKINNPNQHLNDNHVPNVELCRFFSEQAYVNDFQKGLYRFGNLKTYRNSELDIRSDPTESESSNRTSYGGSHGVFSSGNFYTMCFTELNENTQIDNLKEKFGKDGNPAIKLNIEDNYKLTRKILTAWDNSNFSNRIAYFQWFKVQYNKYEIDDTEPNCDLHIYQKPKADIVHKLNRINKSPAPDGCIDLGGEIGEVKKFSNLDALAMLNYNSIFTDCPQDWEILESEINNFEIEQEWRLVFFSGEGVDITNNQFFESINEKYVIL